MRRNIEKDKAQLLEQLGKTPIVQVAAERTGVPRSTIYKWKSSDPKFAKAVEEAIEQSSALINDMAESQLISSIKEGNMTGIIFWLKYHHRRYETRIKVDANVKHESEELTPEQAALVEQALKNAGLLLAKSEVPDES